MQAVTREGGAARGWHFGGRGQARPRRLRPQQPRPSVRSSRFLSNSGLLQPCNASPDSASGNVCPASLRWGWPVPGTCRLAVPPPELPVARPSEGASCDQHASGLAPRLSSVCKLDEISLTGPPLPPSEFAFRSPHGWARGMSPLLSPGTAIVTRQCQAARHSRSCRDLPGAATREHRPPRGTRRGGFGLDPAPLLLTRALRPLTESPVTSRPDPRRPRLLRYLPLVTPAGLLRQDPGTGYIRALFLKC